MEESMSHLFPHKPKDYHAYWTIEGLPEFVARASFGFYENFNHDSILKRKQNQANKETVTKTIGKQHLTYIPHKVSGSQLAKTGVECNSGFFLTYSVGFAYY